MDGIIGDYEQFVAKADDLLVASGIGLDEFVQLDTICYRVETNARYDELKQQLTRVAVMISETEVNERQIAVFEPRLPLVAGRWRTISYIELPQPKPGSFYPEGIDHVQYVTRRGLSDFHETYNDADLNEKGLSNRLNPLLKLSGDGVSVKIHDKHMGSVVQLEKRLV